VGGSTRTFSTLPYPFPTSSTYPPLRVQGEACANPTPTYLPGGTILEEKQGL
jgi:hypothetical protein